MQFIQVSKQSLTKYIVRVAFTVQLLQYIVLFPQTRSCASQHLRQGTTSEQIEQLLLIFAETMVPREVLIDYFKRTVLNSVS